MFFHQHVQADHGLVTGYGLYESERRLHGASLVVGTYLFAVKKTTAIGGDHKTEWDQITAVFFKF